ncbi:MAG: BrnA antitoxin family protein [Treponema sp.]|nr:BrnA antitoxin family protein [Treponema sp.]
MKNIYNDPEKSVMEALDSAILVEDFLPPPSELVRKSTKEKITISIDSDCINFFKAAAKKNHTKYQTMMNEVLSQYAKHYALTI